MERDDLITPDFIWPDPDSNGWVDAWNGWYLTLEEALRDAPAGVGRPWVLSRGQGLINDDDISSGDLFDVWAPGPTGDEDTDADCVGKVLVGHTTSGVYERLTPAEAFDLAARLQEAAQEAHDNLVAESWWRQA